MGLWLGLVLLLVASGLIAYIGDALGRRIGRKRLSLFGLRPRNTAILFTVVTGMLIAGLTLGVLLLVSNDIRDRLLTYDEKVARVEELTSEVSRLEGSARTAREQTDAARQAAQRALVRQRAAEQRFARVDAELTRADAELRRAQATVASARGAVTRLQAERRRAEAQLKRAETELRAARSGRDQAIKARNEAAARLAQTNAELDNAATEMDNAVRYFNETLRRQAELTAQVGAAQRELETAQAQRAEAEAELGRIVEALRVARAQRQDLREAELIFFAGDEIARLLVRGDAAAGARERIQELVGLVNRIARDRGAGERAPGIYAVPGSHDRAAVDAVYLDGLLAAVQTELAGEATGLWLRAVSRYNTIEGEPVDYEVELYRDRLIYGPGEEIARAVIDGAAEPTAIIRELQRLIQEQVNPKVAERGLLPNADGRYTQVGPEIWFPVLERLRALRRPAAVAVVAADAIRTGQPLVVEFRIESGG